MLLFLNFVEVLAWDWGWDLGEKRNAVRYRISSNSCIAQRPLLNIHRKRRNNGLFNLFAKDF